MQNPWLIFIGVIAAFLGFANLENARRGQIFRPMAVFWSLVAGYLGYVNLPDLYPAGDLDALAGIGLGFCAVSPVLGWIWWGRDGLVRKRLGRAVLFLFLTAMGFVVWSLVLGAGAEGAAVVLALLTGCLPFLGIRKRLQQARWRARSRREQRRAHQQARREELQALQQHQAVLVGQGRTAQLERDLEARDRRIAKLKSNDAKRASSLARQREEVAEQIRVLREEEVERVRQGGGHLRFHPHYGFLMAEAWRVLRAQIARGERIPAAEHDAFFYQVVDELLVQEDFGDRYFHSKGRDAIAAVNLYLGGREALATIRGAIARLKLHPALLAPEPLSEYSGQALLEAWLVPHRRFQHRLWEDFQGGRHPRQETVIRFLRDQKLGLPSQQEWRTLWDDHPAVFSGVDPRAPQQPVAMDGAQRLWNAVSSIWNDARGR